MTILVIAEHDNRSIKSATLNCLMAAAQISLFTDSQVHLLVMGYNAQPAVDEAAHFPGVAKVLHADGPQFAHALAENLAAQVLAVARHYSHILFAATASGKNVAPCVAAQLDVAQVSDITRIDGPNTLERPIYAGNAPACVQSLDAIKVITEKWSRNFEQRDKWELLA